MSKTYLILIFSLLLLACKENQPTEVVEISSTWQKIEGETMGTNYTITYSDSLNRNLKQEVDDLLVAFNLEVSTYIDTATISLFNQAQSNKTVLCTNDISCNHFIEILELSSKIYKETAGQFDPTVMPLVNYWGFGYTEKRKVTKVDEQKIRKLMQSVGFDKISWTAEKDVYRLEKKNAASQLDFSAIAKGFGVDIVAELLSDKGILDYMVEIGGEVSVKGKNSRNKDWVLGIRLPKSGVPKNTLQATIELKDLAMATSGNYENFYEVDGQKYAHTINPKTGYPQSSEILSATITAKDCAVADAYATACMVMGLPKAIDFIQQIEGVEAYFIYSKADGGLDVVMTDSMKNIIEIR